MNLAGITTSTPAVSITKQEMEAVRAVSVQENNVYTGTLLVSGEIKTVADEAAYTMSDFSSWGCNMCNYFVYVNRGSLTVEQGAWIQNCKTYGIRLYPDGSTSVAFHGGVLQNNGTGALYGYAKETANPSLVLSPTAGTELSVSGDLNLKSTLSTSYLPMKLTIAGSLDNLTLPGGGLYLTGHLKDGHVVAVPAEGYTITQSDLEKLKLRDESLTLVLEDGNVVVRTASGT